MAKEIGGEALGRFFVEGKKVRSRREWRGLRDTLYDYSRWLFIMGQLSKFVMKPRNVKAMFRYQSGSISVFNCLNAAIIIMLVIGILLAGPLQYIFPKLQNLRKPETPVRVPEFVLLMGLYFFSTVSLVSDSYNAFIYFRF